jgi:sialic acid synthase SpsE
LGPTLENRYPLIPMQIDNRTISENDPTYFIADISANHDGDLERAKLLIKLAAESGADAAKFQHFEARQIVSDEGFRALKGQVSHQAKWKQSVFEVYKSASLPRDWTPILKEECRKCGIAFFSSPYDVEAVDLLDPFVSVYKIGSGDVTWLEYIDYVGAKGKPVLIAAGAATLEEVRAAVNVLQKHRVPIGLFQCNTNYTGSVENFRYIHLNVLKTFRREFPDVILGLSDHTPGHATVLGAVALGARLIEKHFTDDNNREGPDHPFSMTPKTWRDMADRTRELEAALGGEEKKVEENEIETVVIQRRGLRAAVDLKKGIRITRDMISILRPAPKEAFSAAEIGRLVGAELAIDLKAGESIGPEAIKTA